MAYADEVLADSPLFYWRLDESSGTLANDTTTNNRDGTLSSSGLTYSQSGIAGNPAILFDGSAGTLETASSLDLTGATSVVTIEFWLKVSAWNDTFDTVTEFSTNWSSNSGTFAIHPCNADSTFSAHMKTGGVNEAHWTRPSTGSYHHYVFVFKELTTANAITAYLDGATWTADSRTETGETDSLGNHVMYFMCRAASSLQLAGTLDEVAVYGSELSSARVAAHYNAAVGIAGAVSFPIAFNAFSFGKTAATQFAFPDADSADGAWTDQAGGASLFAAINTTGYPENDWIRSEVSPQTSGCRVKLGTLEQPPVVDTGHVIRWRASKDMTAGDQINMTVTLRQGGGTTLGGGTQIATFVRNNVTDSFTTFAETLSEAEAATITNYNDLYLEFYADVP